jgi:hypothetical protein
MAGKHIRFGCVIACSLHLNTVVLLVLCIIFPSTSVLLFTATMLHGDHFSVGIDLFCSVESACSLTGPGPESEKCALSHATLNGRRLSGIKMQNNFNTFCSLVAPGWHYLSAVLIEPAGQMRAVFIFIGINVRNIEISDEISFSTGWLMVLLLINGNM